MFKKNLYNLVISNSSVRTRNVTQSRPTIHHIKFCSTDYFKYSFIPPTSRLSNFSNILNHVFFLMCKILYEKSSLFMRTLPTYKKDSACTYFDSFFYFSKCSTVKSYYHRCVDRIKYIENQIL